MEQAGILDEKTEECENMLELLKKRSQINQADEKKWSNHHKMHHQSKKQYGNVLSLDNEESLSIQSSLDMLNCTGSPPWECTPPRVPCYGNIRQAGQANGALPIQVITDMSPNSDSEQSVCTPPRVPSSDDVAGQTPKKYNEKKYEETKYDDTIYKEAKYDDTIYKETKYNDTIYKETKYDEYDKNHDVDKFVVPKFKLKGSFHQGDKRFGMNAGKQCVSNCFTAVIYSKLKNVRDWKTSHINDILVQGNLLYNSFHGSKDFLLVSEMPTSIELFNSSFFVNFGDSINAIDSEIDAGFPFALPLNIGIENALIDADGCFVSVNGYTSLVIKQGIRLFYFDSHSRDLQGKLCENGSSIVIELNDICHLYHILKEFVKDDPQSLFEITSVNVTISSNEKDKSNTKKTYNDDKTNVVKDKDLEILGSYLCSNLNYIPLGYITKQKLCSKFKISHKNVKETADISITFNMGKPVKLKSIISDGNCLFRALSFAISQRQEYHKQIRKKIVDHILHISKDLSSFVRDPYENAEEYVRMQKMKESNIWGTELEILAAAHFMQADIYTFTNNKWIKYTAHQIDKDITVENEAIYLKHVEESSHYEVVMSVEGNREYDLSKNSKNNKSIYVDFDKLQSNVCTDHDIKKSNTLLNEIFEIVEHTDITDLTKKRSREVEVNISNDNAKYQRRTPIDGNHVVEDRDLEMLHPAVYSGLNYIPLGYKTMRKLCSKFKISQKNIKETSGVNEMFNMDKKKDSRSHIAYFQRHFYFVRDPYENAEEYVRMRKMKEPKPLGTELEILAAAHFMQADIYTFTNNKWIKYSAHQMDKDINVENEAIYLHHVEKSSHYEVVMNVEGNRIHSLPEKSKQIEDCTSVKYDFDQISRNSCTDTKNNNTLLNETQVDLTDLRRKRRRELEKMRYCQNDTVRDKKKRSCKETYWNNAIYRSLKIYKGSMKYINDETYRQDLIEKGKMKYIHDLDYRLRMKRKGKLKYEMDEEYRDNLIEKGKRKYEENEIYRANLIKNGKKKYEEHEAYRSSMITKGKQKYEENETYRANMIEKGKKKYEEDETYRTNMIEKRKKEYEEDETYRNNKIVKGKKKYEEDEIYRNNMIEKVKERRSLFTEN
ncbi:unnamed protein product [Mytilus coruscus]|uniref:OTU domain-containing protein n=1 Tax=Mytilus coruscus TaxID=42192 RepID=A0A6J8C717_MYTCO|nr:unnamed protein product [Mytilus coruscus]